MSSGVGGGNPLFAAIRAKGGGDGNGAGTIGKSEGSERVNSSTAESAPSTKENVATASGFGADKEGSGEKMELNAKKSTDISASAAEDGVKLKDHPIYAKYFKMIKVNIPPPAVKAKMVQEGVDPSYLDLGPDAIFSDKKKEEDGIKLKDHPVYSKYFKMLKVSIPPPAVKAKMAQEGADPSMLDKGPDFLLSEKNSKPEPEAPDAVPLKEHPVYAKYFKMLKVGLPPPQVKRKMTEEGVDQSVLDRQPEEKLSATLRKFPNKAPSIVGSIGAKKEPAKKMPRKKKLYWKALDASRVTENSLWADNEGEDEDIVVDENEFKKLFVESVNSPRKRTASGGVGSPELKSTSKVTFPKKKIVYLVDMKRGQNASIALSRIKMAHADVRSTIASMDDEPFSADQLALLLEYLPTDEEQIKLRSYKGDLELLGQAEKFMLEMVGFDAAAPILEVLLYKKHFQERLRETTSIVSKVERACDDVKLSKSLKKVMKTILKVGNQMNSDNDDEAGKHVAFSLDSLLKLQSAKAFDKKTSILQYVIMLIYRNDKECLSLPEDLCRIAEASRITMDSVESERKQLKLGLESAILLVEKRKSNRGSSPRKHPPTLSAHIEKFLEQAARTVNDLDLQVNKVTEKYMNVLAYFGEDNLMPSHRFFETLHSFVLAFSNDREAFLAQKKREERAAARESDKPTGKATEARPRRGSQATGNSKAALLDAIVGASIGLVGSSSEAAGTTNAGTEKKKANRRASIM